VKPTDGTTPSNAAYDATDYIPIEAGEHYYIVADSGTTIASSSGYAFYNASKVYISGETYYNDPLPCELTAPSNAAFIRVTVLNGCADEFCLGVGTVPNYVQYGAVSYKDAVDTLFEDNNNFQSVSDKVSSVMSGAGFFGSAASITNDSQTFNDYPHYVQNDQTITLHYQFTGTHPTVKFGKGASSSYGAYAVLDDTNISLYYRTLDNTETLIETVAHGLTLSEFVYLTLRFEGLTSVHASIMTITDSYSHSFTRIDNVPCHELFVSSTGTIRNVKVSGKIENTKCGLWVFGDSYLGFPNDRVMGQLKNLGYYKGFLLDRLSGLGTVDGLADLQRLAQMGTPSIIVWYLGMNGSESNYLTTIAEVIRYCDDNDITLILNRVPTTPSRDKEFITTFINNHDYRYIDSYAAVGTDNTGAWTSGMLSGDDVHPTALGAKALANRFLLDVPELAGCGFDIGA
jgi:hypothetical protein